MFGLRVRQLPCRSSALPPLRRAADPHTLHYYGDYGFKRQIGSGGPCCVDAGLQLSLRKEVAFTAGSGLRPSTEFNARRKSSHNLPLVGIVGTHRLGRLPRGGYFMATDLIDGRSGAVNAWLAIRQ